MPLLYLIRHPQTQPDPLVPASQWRLTAEGHAQVERLAASPLWKGTTAIYTSQEYKTAAVGEAIRAAHGLTFVPMADLGEAKRDTWVGSEDFYAAQASFFAQPDEPPVEGWESANAARARFVTAMESLLARHPAGESLAVVSHATVLTLYLAHLRGDVPDFEVWRLLGFMTIMALDRASLRPLTEFLPYPYAGLPLP